MFSADFEDLYPARPLLSTSDKQTSALLYSLILAVNSNYYDHSGSVFNENLMSIGIYFFLRSIIQEMFLFSFFLNFFSPQLINEENLVKGVVESLFSN
jgi:hypothetical protein